jgi:SH3-like domain-containing protein
VYVRRVAGIDSRDDPQIADGSPVLVGMGPPMVVGARAWRAVRGLNGVVGWVPSSQLVVDGEATPSPTPNANPIQSQSRMQNQSESQSQTQSQSESQPRRESQSQSSSASATPASTVQAAEHGRIANTGGAGVVLRNSPTDGDRSRAGLMDGATVSLLEFSGNDWVHVRADNGQSGWVPARYVNVG